MSGGKVKGLLKGLRYISQIFEHEKEPEMQIGFPTDVKHVAHIGSDASSVNSPSWMNEFKSPPEFSSPIAGEIKEDTKRRHTNAPNSPARDLPELPKASRRHHSSGEAFESHSTEKSDRPRQSRKSSKNTGLPDIPRKSRQKKLKDNSSVGGSTRSSTSRSKAQAPESYTSPYSDPGSGPGTVSRFKSNDPIKHFEEGEDLTRIS